MKNWETALVFSNAAMLDAMQTLERTAAKICVVVGEDRRLLGTVTDGDIRRSILKGFGLDTAVSQIMNAHPHSYPADTDRTHLLAMMRRERLWQVPLVDGQGRVVGLETAAELLELQPRDNWVVLMAGGEGRRLYPLTKDTPKPMLQIGSKPILETILDSFIDAGFKQFFLSVNYLADQVETHFGDGSKWGVNIQYLREDRKLGTAGALKLLPQSPTEPFFVMNGDILTNVDFGHVLDFHTAHQAAATMCVREHVLQIPYGVVDLDGHKLLGVTEKPVISNYVNAGIYCLNPEVLPVMAGSDGFDMPQLFADLQADGRPCAAFPISEYWLDVGHMADFNRANDEFEKVFG